MYEGGVKMKNKNQAAFGIFRRKSEIRLAKNELQARGFSNLNIATLYPARHSGQGSPQEGKTLLVTGALTGAGIGGLVFMIVGFLVYTGAIPLFALQNFSALQGVLLVFGFLVGGIVLGAASGALVGIGTPQSVGKRFGGA